MHERYAGYDPSTDEVPSPLLKWGAVLGGLVLGLALLLLLSALWLALAYGSDITEVQDALEWYIGLSAVGSLFVAGMLTGYLSGVRGAGPGMLHGFTLWGLLMIITVTVGIPSVLNVFGLQQIADQAASGRLIATGDEGALWATFWTILGGFVAAGLGGMIGGLSTRAERRSPVVVQQERPVTAPQQTRVVVPEADDRDETEVVPTRTSTRPWDS
jgi:hypothetical protein